MATDKTLATPQPSPTRPLEPSPTHPLEPPFMTVDEVVYLLADKNKPPMPFCYEDYPEWKRWALAGGLEQFAKSHNVQVSFLLHSMPEDLRNAYVDTIMQNQDLRNAIDAQSRNKAYLSDADSYSIMAMIEGWDEEDSESEEESLCLSEVEVDPEASEAIGLNLQSDNGSTLRSDTRLLSSPCKRRVSEDFGSPAKRCRRDSSWS